MVAAAMMVSACGDQAVPEPEREEKIQIEATAKTEEAVQTETPEETEEGDVTEEQSEESSPDDVIQWTHERKGRFAFDTLLYTFHRLC